MKATADVTPIARAFLEEIRRREEVKSGKSNKAPEPFRDRRVRTPGRVSEVQRSGT